MKTLAWLLLLPLLLAVTEKGLAQTRKTVRTYNSPVPDSLQKAAEAEQQPLLNAWGMDILISDGGFGLGAFYRREFNDEWYGFASLGVSEAKDDREVEQFDIYGQSYTPGKLNRFLVLPLIFGVQHRLFKDDITDNFRPYVNAGVGPTMIYITPFTNITYSNGSPLFEQVRLATWPSTAICCRMPKSARRLCRNRKPQRRPIQRWNSRRPRIRSTKSILAPSSTITWTRATRVRRRNQWS